MFIIFLNQCWFIASLTPRTNAIETGIEMENFDLDPPAKYVNNKGMSCFIQISTKVHISGENF